MYKIILIDDEKTILTGLKKIIDWSEEGYYLDGAFSNALEAADFLRTHQVDIIITDLMMPELNGIELSQLVKQQYPETQILVLSSYDDFYLVKDAFKSGISDYILKPKLTPEILLSTLHTLARNCKKNNKNAAVDQEKLLRTQLSDYLSGTTRELNIPLDTFKHPQFYLLYVKSDFPLQSTDLIKNERNYSNEQINLFSFMTNESEFGFLINTDTKQSLEVFLTRFEQDTSLKKSSLFILSRSFDISDLYDNFINLRNLSTGQTFYWKNCFLIDADNLTPLISGYDHNSNKYLTMIINKDYQSALSELKDYFAKLCALKLQPNYLKHETINQFYPLLSALSDEDEENKMIASLKVELPNQLSSAIYLEDFCKIVNNTFDQLTKLIVPAKRESYEILTWVYEFIQENYNKEINLQSISDKYHLSYGYLSTIFTEKYGISFSKYLKKVRITKAKEFLERSNLTLSEICYEIGYTELGYFSRVFKDETGITPSQYRKGKLKK